MIGAEKSPGSLARLLEAIPEGALLRVVFVAVLALSVGVVAVDYRAVLERAASTERQTRTEPVPMRRPAPGDQIRPYLPRTIPVGPERGIPSLPGYDGPVEGEALAEPMRFIAGPNGAMTALGMLTPGTADRLSRFLASPEAHGVRTVTLHSPGGSVDDAIAMARLLREASLSTRVPADGYCASACPLVLAGGLTRSAGEGAWIGVHQVYAIAEPGVLRNLDRSIADIQATLARCQELLVSMGVDPSVWIKAMQTPPDSLYVLTVQELARFRMIQRFPDDETFIGPPAPFDVLAPSVSRPAQTSRIGESESAKSEG